jgi:hypothetical protein
MWTALKVFARPVLFRKLQRSGPLPWRTALACKSAVLSITGAVQASVVGDALAASVRAGAQ